MLHHGEMALRLARYFGTTAEFWLNLQSHFDRQVAEDDAMNEWRFLAIGAFVLIAIFAKQLCQFNGAFISMTWIRSDDVPIPVSWPRRRRSALGRHHAHCRIRRCGGGHGPFSYFRGYLEPS